MAIYVLFDTETTGNQEHDRIIQVGAMIVHNRENIEIFDELCSTEVPISIEAMEIHNITSEHIENKVPFSQTEFFKEIEKYNNKENYLIAHNISFDLGMLEKEGFVNHYTLIDTVRIAKHLLPDSPYHRLQYLRYSLKLYKTEIEEAKKLGIT
ncbi:MAG: 3'-5' exonuclease, partial [Sulfurovum sp.]|nr:3'-5' exonuclease [Sulfurovum sp.]